MNLVATIVVFPLFFKVFIKKNGFGNFLLTKFRPLIILFIPHHLLKLGGHCVYRSTFTEFHG